MYDVLCAAAEDGDKYELVDRGLRINRLEVWDDGTYECRAEVASHGNVKLRHVRLEVLCKNTMLSAPAAVFQSHDFVSVPVYSARQHAQRAIGYRQSVRPSVKNVEVGIMQFSQYSRPHTIASSL